MFPRLSAEEAALQFFITLNEWSWDEKAIEVNGTMHKANMRDADRDKTARIEVGLWVFVCDDDVQPNKEHIARST